MQIEVAFVNRPNKNPKFGSIKGTDGIYYSVGADVLDRYRKGMTFDAPVSSREYQGKTYYSIPDSFDPNTVGAIIPQGQVYPPHDPRVIDAAARMPAPPRQAAPAYVPKEEFDMIVARTAILKSLIESGALLKGMGMDDLVAMAWETAPKLKVWK